jgi:hypothetical protein
MIIVITTVALTLTGTWLFYRVLLGAQGVRGKTALGIVVASAVLAFPTRLLIAYVLDSFGWALRIGPTVSAVKAWLSAVVVVAALEHLVLLVVVSPIYRSHRLERLGTALSAAGLAAAGYGMSNAAFSVVSTPSAMMLFRGLGCFILSVFCAGIWASCLTTSHVRYRPWIPVAWLVAVLLDGSIRHLLIARTGGLLLVTLLMLVAMVVIGGFWARKLQGPRESIMFTQAHLLGLHVDGHKLDTVRAAFQHTHRPALLHWIVGGAFVSFGASLVGLAIGVFLARWLSIDLSHVDETNANALLPLLLLGGCVLMSFAVAGFCTAKASSADSLFEPGMAALISILALTVLLARSAPVTLVLGLAIAPVAFALACVGAWLGQERKR